jgi:hypothetical protein
MDAKFGNWDVRSLCRSGALKTVGRVLAYYRFDLVGLHELRWGRGDIDQQGITQFHLWKEERK